MLLAKVRQFLFETLSDGVVDGHCIVFRSFKFGREGAAG